ncbi:MAG: hypothetical protein QM765_32565 [Myxococcales bacterium]
MVFAALLTLAACPGDPTTEPSLDANGLRPDAAAQPRLDASEQPGADASTSPMTDASVVGEPDASSTPNADAATAAVDASTSAPDAGGAPTSPAIAVLGGASDAVSSYLINASPAAWNIFSGEHVPLGRHFDTAHVSYHTALRFPAVNVPAGATVTSAKLTFYPHNSVDSSNNLWINLYAEKAVSSAPFDPTNYDSGRPDQRAKTTALFDHWLVRCRSDCTDLSEYDCPQRKLDCWDPAVAFTCPKDFKAMVQEVIDQPGWAAGNAMTIFLINAATDQDDAKYQGYRTIVGYDPAAVDHAPKLVVEFTQ